MPGAHLGGRPCKPKPPRLTAGQCVMSRKLACRILRACAACFFALQSRYTCKSSMLESRLHRSDMQDDFETCVCLVLMNPSGTRGDQDPAFHVQAPMGHGLLVASCRGAVFRARNRCRKHFISRGTSSMSVGRMALVGIGTVTPGTGT
jgi:hypothetical protein